ncbi:N-acyl-phosphatidylethanolamine-hydrolyzing phospholipase D [Haloferula luteola]|uniref:N-acyl-phosphatidylethanolamine-hydrolyzing phospholipase D n=1 Tax=Haloferula luteola TaxID=595692 RepID=A0A840VIL9_9BACT|nr:MBL fold metallo-hydrolase [Haloferula luteola]MBB5352551.1 N-acyl-phosphatidylethanolamine-hydrolyzing phospholipase D [Haloferula luteola]
MDDGAPSWREVLRWKLGRGPQDADEGAPDTPAEVVSWVRRPLPDTGWRVSWLGHASFLLEGQGRRLLIDPVFSDFCAPLPLPSMKRLSPPPCSVEALGEVDAVLLTHTHYDHLDLPTLRHFRGSMMVVPTGYAGWMQRRGFESVRELGWWDEMELFDGVSVKASPARHFSARTPFDRNPSGCCGYRIEGGGVALWHAGDSGDAPIFDEVGERWGPVDFGMIPIGAYSPRWFMSRVHLDPRQATRVFRVTRCRRAVGMHWGTFRLTDEPMGEPPLLLEREGIEGFFTGKVGESWWVGPLESMQSDAES